MFKLIDGRIQFSEGLYPTHFGEVMSFYILKHIEDDDDNVWQKVTYVNVTIRYIEMDSVYFVKNAKIEEKELGVRDLFNENSEGYAKISNHYKYIDVFLKDFNNECLNNLTFITFDNLMMYLSEHDDV